MGDVNCNGLVLPLEDVVIGDDDDLAAVVVVSITATNNIGMEDITEDDDVMII